MFALCPAEADQKDAADPEDLAAAHAAQDGILVSGGGDFGDEVRRGERMFNDASMCFQNWLSCASCRCPRIAPFSRWPRRSTIKRMPAPCG